MILAVTGSMQSGKQESALVYAEFGIRFVDLNTFADAARLECRGLYEALGLSDGIEDNGKENGLFYRKILANPRLHRATMEIEIPAVLRETRELLASHPRGAPIVLSWGYAYQLTRSITFDKVLLFRCERPIWRERIRRRGAEMGLPNFPNEVIDGIASTLEMDPDAIMREVVESVGTERTIVHDTTAPDWNVDGLRAILGSLRQ